LAEQVGVNAPGTENNTTFLPPNNSPVLMGLGPLAVMVVKVAAGTLSPARMLMSALLNDDGLAGVVNALHHA